MKTGFCVRCGRPLMVDEIALCQKLLGMQLGRFYCLGCLAQKLNVEPFRLRTFMEQLKAVGCGYFTRLTEE